MQLYLLMSQSAFLSCGKSVDSCTKITLTICRFFFIFPPSPSFPRLGKLVHLYRFANVAQFHSLAAPVSCGQSRVSSCVFCTVLLLILLLILSPPPLCTLFLFSRLSCPVSLWSGVFFASRALSICVRQCLHRACNRTLMS